MKKITKKLAVLVMAGIMLLALAGCTFTCAACGESSFGSGNDIFGETICDDCYDELMGMFG